MLDEVNPSWFKRVYVNVVSAEEKKKAATNASNMTCRVPNWIKDVFLKKIKL